MWEQLIIYAGIKAIDLIANHIKRRDAKKGLQASKEASLIAEARDRVLKYKASIKFKKAKTKVSSSMAAEWSRSSNRSHASSMRSHQRDLDRR